ncbi:MAG: GIY-YIG nuclease family protein [Acidobacteria bacterium]|nr:GIY-YIG nuclease family protein [Acidobacteriota bacterium]
MAEGQRIYLHEIFHIPSSHDYKIHFAIRSGNTEPLHVWMRGLEGWKEWQESKNRRRWGDSRHVFSLMRMYRESNMWLFGGIFRIVAEHSEHYEVELTEIGQRFIGRLKLKSSYEGGQQKYVNLENHYGPDSKYTLEVSELLVEPYAGPTWSGYDNIHLPFSELEHIMDKSPSSWRVPLGSVNGIYLITDTSKPAGYVGCTWGSAGIWQRWAGYIASGHNGNKGLVRHLRGKNIPQYCRDHFHFTLLEYHPINRPQQAMEERERWWKQVLQTGASRFRVEPGGRRDEVEPPKVWG